MDQDSKTREFYNEYGIKEWERLERTAYDKLNFMLHLDFLQDHLQEGAQVIDLGCGAGRFSIEIAKRKCDLTILDISEKQLELAEAFLEQHQLAKQLKRVCQASIANMDMIDSDTYDLAVCYGAPLSYLYSNYPAGIQELYRIIKPGGRVFVSVNSRLGIFRMLLHREGFNAADFFANPGYWQIPQVYETGDLPEHPEVRHPARHFFTADELADLFQEAGFTDIALASSPCLVSGNSSRIEELSQNDKAWKTIMDLEKKTYKRRELADSGEFLLLSGMK